jgi:[lysine-biosynthesis-protein LysW]--L-2-aminoadipate ligase
MYVGVIAHQQTPTNIALAVAPNIRVLSPGEALRTLVAGDVAIGRLDVTPELDGIEVGLWELARLEAKGVLVLNRPDALVAAHDKLATARALEAARVPHPLTAHVTEPSLGVSIRPPVVVKPRFGSWGRDVFLCEDLAALRACLTDLAARAWFSKHGVIVQEFVPAFGRDLRLVVARDTVVGAIQRIAAPGEWRTNVALGAKRRPVSPPPDACAVALAAARAIEGDLVGVDLLPTPDGGFVVLELNGAVEFNHVYALDGGDVFERTLAALFPMPAAEPAAVVA